MPATWWRCCIGALAAAALLPSAQALQSDRQQPLHVLADSMQYDDVAQHDLFVGHVVVTKGTLRLQADKLEVWHTPDGFDHAIAFGSAQQPAVYDQQLDSEPGQPKVRAHGSGIKLTWDGGSETVEFDGQASFERYLDDKLNDRAQGQRILYNDLSDRFSAFAGSGGVSADNPSGRVRLMLAPRPQAASAPAVQAAPQTTQQPAAQR